MKQHLTLEGTPMDLEYVLNVEQEARRKVVELNAADRPLDLTALWAKIGALRNIDERLAACHVAVNRQWTVPQAVSVLASVQPRARELGSWPPRFS
jgi:hypothetical protein